MTMTNKRIKLVPLAFVCLSAWYCTGGNSQVKPDHEKRQMAPHAGIRKGDSLMKMEGHVVQVIDGDTYALLLADSSQERIRLLGIDCPERSQNYYQVAKAKLEELIAGKHVLVEYTYRDRNKRVVGDTRLEDGTWVNYAMVRSGLAWHFTRYSDSEKLAEAEKAAKAEKLHIWSKPDAVPPWEFRKRH
jgi:micrococcal nuclease